MPTHSIKNYSLGMCFSHINHQLVTLLEDILKFNPDQRLSAKEALKSPVFDDIRVRRLEQEAQYKVNLPCDQKTYNEESVESLKS